MSRRLLMIAMLMLPAAVLLLGAPAALAAGIGVTPGRMAFSVRAGSNETQTLYVINQDSQASDFEVYVEGADNGWFTITPGRFTLDGRGKQEVEIALAPPLTADPREYDLSICVVSIPPGGDLRIGAGIKVPAHVEVTGLPIMTIQWWIVSVIVLGCLAIGGIIWWRRRVRYG